MEAHLLLWTAGLLFAAVTTASTSRLLDRARPNWPLWLKLSLSSLALPLGWVAFQAAILPFILEDPRARAGFGSLRQRYLQEILFGIGLKLWLCGAICAGFLWRMRSRSSPSSKNSWSGFTALWLLGVGCAAATILPYAMPLWIETGHIGGKGLIVVPFFGFCVGFVPTYAVALYLFLRDGTAGLQWVKPFATAYAITIGLIAVVLQRMVADLPGAWSIVLMSAVALLGVWLAWWRARLAMNAGSNEVAAALLARPGFKPR